MIIKKKKKMVIQEMIDIYIVASKKCIWCMHAQGHALTCKLMRQWALCTLRLFIIPSTIQLTLSLGLVS